MRKREKLTNTVQYDKLKNNGEEEVYTYLCAEEGKKIGIWMQMGVGRNNELEICSMCRTEEDLNHLLTLEETKMWMDEILDMRFRDIEVEIGITRIVVYKNREQYTVSTRMRVRAFVCVCFIYNFPLNLLSINFGL